MSFLRFYKRLKRDGIFERADSGLYIETRNVRQMQGKRENRKWFEFEQKSFDLKHLWVIPEATIKISFLSDG